MTYETIYTNFLSNFPELETDILSKVSENHIIEEDGMHVKFGLAIVPVIIELAKRDAPVIARLCDFFEKMASCPDVRVQELLDLTILESLVDDKPALAVIKQHMYRETLAHCEEVERLML